MPLSSDFPVSLARTALQFVPSGLLARSLPIIMQRMQSRHPKLFTNLAQLPLAIVHLVPTDIPYGFALGLGQEPVSFTVLDPHAPEKPDARIAGPLQALIDMLEGRVDGDTLFFRRDISVVGDTSVVVGLRNTLDREEIDLFSEILSLCGPFAKPAGLVLGFADHALSRIKQRIAGVHEEMHRKNEKAQDHASLS